MCLMANGLASKSHVLKLVMMVLDFNPQSVFSAILRAPVRRVRSESRH